MRFELFRRGISKFYGGKSKSFTSLADAVSCSSIKEIVKPEDAYTRKRKNLLAHGTLWDKNRHYPPKSNSVGMSKRSASSRSTLALAASLSGYESKNNSENSKLSSPPPILCRPPLHPHGRISPCNESLTTSPQRNLSPWRSFSLSDLQCAAATTPCITGIEIISGDKDEVPWSLTLLSGSMNLKFGRCSWCLYALNMFSGFDLVVLPSVLV